MPGIAEVHPVPPPLDRPGVCENLLAAAGIDKVDAPFDAAGNDVVAVLLKGRIVDGHRHPPFRLAAADDLDQSLPVPAQRYGRDHHPRSAASPVLHVRTVTEDFRPVRHGGAARTGCHPNGSHHGRRSRGISKKTTARNVFIHLAALRILRSQCTGQTPSSPVTFSYITREAPPSQGLRHADNHNLAAFPRQTSGSSRPVPDQRLFSPGPSMSLSPFSTGRRVAGSTA